MNRFVFWMIVGILVIGLALRLFDIGSLPSILNRDEAALAYNGLLLNQAGVDEWGVKWPLVLQSFGDYKLPGYSYLLAMLFILLPTSDLIVRLPSVVAGAVMPLLIYLLARNFGLNKLYSLSTSVLVATSYVFFFYSRIGFEANVALVLVIGSLVLLFRQRTFIWSDVIATCLMLMAILFYNTPLLLTPLILVCLIFWRGIRNFHSWLLPTISMTIIFVVMMILLLPITQQKNGVTIFTDEQILVDSYPAFRSQLPQIFQTIVGNRYVFFSLLTAKKLLASFGPGFIVTQGGSHPWHSISNWGHYNWLVYLLFMIGLGWLIVKFSKKIINAFARNSYRKSVIKHVFQPFSNYCVGRQSVLLLLTLGALLPAAITIDAPHTTRSLLFLALVPILVMITLSDYLQLLARKYHHQPERLSIITLIVICLFSVINFGRYLNDYLGQYRYEQSLIFQAGFDKTIRLLEKDYAAEQIAIVDPSGYQYILLSWYLKMPAAEYLQNNVRQQPDKIGFRYGERVGRYHFIAAAADKGEETVLVLWNGQDWQIQKY